MQTISFNTDSNFEYDKFVISYDPEGTGLIQGAVLRLCCQCFKIHMTIVDVYFVNA